MKLMNFKHYNRKLKIIMILSKYSKIRNNYLVKKIMKISLIKLIQI